MARNQYEGLPWAELVRLYDEHGADIRFLMWERAAIKAELHRRLDEEGTDEMSGERFVVVRDDREKKVFNVKRFRDLYPVEYNLFCDKVAVKGVRVYG